MGTGWLASVFIGVATAAQVVAGGANPSFDAPLRAIHVALPRDKDNRDAKPEVRCTYFAHFMVKEIDLGEIGAYQLSILPVAQKPPACRSKKAQGERIVSADDWTGYFKGAAGNYIFFDAEDGWNGGLGFAIFTPDAKKLFDDVAKGTISVMQATDAELLLRYRRVYGAKCSLGDKNAIECWKTIEKQTGINSPMPDCKSLYAREQKHTPQFAKEVLNDPAVVDYDAAATLSATGSHVTAVSGRAISCAPQD
jgi:hypothetical protein